MRRFLAIALCSSISLSFSSAGETEKKPIELRELPLLFADDSAVAVSSGVVRTVHAAKTRSEPVLKAEKPWESGRVYIYGSVYRDGASGLLRMWYLARIETEKDIDSVAVPGFRKHKYDVDLYATSKDGLTWDRPSLGIHAYAGSKENNILFDLHSPSVLLDEKDPDPARRYKMLGAFSGRYWAAVSPDGLNWSKYPDEKPVLKYADNICLTQDPNTGEYLAYHRAPSKVRGRNISLSRSRDFKTWTEPELVFAPDESDNEWAKNKEERMEVNNMSVIPHASGYLGFPTMFRILGVNGPQSKLPTGQSSTDGIIDVQLATSEDGVKWNRTNPRVNVISRGAPGAFDGGTILGVSTNSVDVGDETWMFYTGLTTSHGAEIPPKRVAIGRAEWRRHGFVSLDAGIKARVETKPLKLSSPNLLVNADAGGEGAELKVALLDANGEPLEGYSADECEPLTANATRWPVKWKSGRQAPVDKPVRVAIQMRQTRLYSLSVEGAAAAKK